MGYFQVRYASRVVIYERKMFIRLATGIYLPSTHLGTVKLIQTSSYLKDALVTYYHANKTGKGSSNFNIQVRNLG